MISESPMVRSYEKFNYLLRPSKQVERKLFIEALHHLCSLGYPIYRYTYLGFGSVYYADFILFHKYLYMKSMICVERDDIERRMTFNRPYRFIKLVMKPVSQVIPELSRKRKYLVWLDYDRQLDIEMLEEIYGFLQILEPGSLFIVTVDSEPRLPEHQHAGTLSIEEAETKLLELVRTNFGQLVSGEITKQRLTPEDMPMLYSEIIKSHIETSLLSRQGVKFHQLFNFVYADGAQMLTFGGLLDDTRGRIAGAARSMLTLPCFCTSSRPERISVPPLTVREKQWIDSNLKVALSRAKRIDLDETLVRNYIKYYKYYPTYYETLT